ncbi:endonuclease domain-containing protein [Reichenbachiella ulvae]|uniref:DUF559 domain-containing protein n=1 Tax=Reichenbachiella ulvae TaxID=2980104 RepID=A0ABT3CXY3_9BACT|nr:DUF559 domain-containing protein [Reichenbachiella ulvae]MCV9388502.1 DUF559 domain-containing protein [Reichenbachiella ulvae]
MDDSMFFGASPIIFERAKELRKHMTAAESLLWDYLRKKKLKGLKFRRQHPIANYIVDFYCHSIKLVIELDGSIHDLDSVKENDIEREEHLKSLGLWVLRFRNELVQNKLHVVLTQIEDCA